MWPLLRVVDVTRRAVAGARCAHLGGAQAGEQEVRRFATVRHLAELFDRYALHRPEMLRAWAGGEDTDGAGRALPRDGVWQAELWRRLRARIGRPSPAERLEHARARGCARNPDSSSCRPASRCSA